MRQHAHFLCACNHVHPLLNTAAAAMTECDQEEDYRTYLKGLYGQLTPTKPSLNEWPPSTTQKYFSLAMIKEEQLPRGDVEHDFVELTLFGKVEEIMRKKCPIELKDIFKETKDDRKLILLEGAPGSGKSVLSVHIVQECSKGNLFMEYKVVILVRLRDPEVQKAKCIADLLPGRNQKMKEQAADRMISSDGKNVLFVFDGWDELPLDLHRNSIFFDLLTSQDRRLHNSAVIVTSRPIACGDLHTLISTRIEILGFTASELKKYFTECLDIMTVQTLLCRIKGNPIISGFCYLPLNANIIVHLFKCDNVLPTTQYGIFLELILTCLYRHCTKCYDHKNMSLDSLDQLPEELKKPLLCICKLAYDGIINNKVTFDNLPQDFNTLSLLNGCESLLVRGKKTYYNFIHLSIQEFLAAHYIATQLAATEQASTFNDLFGESRFSTVFQFYAAITKLQTPGISDIVARVAESCAVEHAEDEDKFLLVALLNCLYEAHDSTLCTTVAGHLACKLNLLGINLSPGECLSVSYFFSHTKNFELLILTSIGTDGAKILFSDERIYDLHALDTFG